VDRTASHYPRARAGAPRSPAALPGVCGCSSWHRAGCCLTDKVTRHAEWIGRKTVRLAMSRQARRELLVQVAPRYREAPGVLKSRILDAFVASTGYARKYAIRLLRQPVVAPARPLVRPRARQYGPAAFAATSDAVCAPFRAALSWRPRTTRRAHAAPWPHAARLGPRWAGQSGRRGRERSRSECGARRGDTTKPTVTRRTINGLRHPCMVRPRVVPTALRA
jgi:hypothetical protein